MGTITGISDLDPVRWPNSHWRSVKVLQQFTTSLFLFTLCSSACLDFGLQYEWLSTVLLIW